LTLWLREEGGSAKEKSSVLLRGGGGCAQQQRYMNILRMLVRDFQIVDLHTLWPGGGRFDLWPGGSILEVWRSTRVTCRSDQVLRLLGLAQSFQDCGLTVDFE